MKQVIPIIEKLAILIALGCLIYSSYFFFKFNAPIIKKDWLMILLSAVLILGMGATIFWRRTTGSTSMRIMNLTISLVASGFIIYSLLKSVLLDYFQPLALYDQIIYVSLVGFAVLIIYFITQSVTALFSKSVNLHALVIILLSVVFVLLFYGLSMFQKDFAYKEIEGTPIKVFNQNEAGYASFRIPGLLVINKGEILNDGQQVTDDIVIVFAEARRNGSLDTGDIDLVQKISRDGGITWSDLTVVRSYPDGLGKIGNPTPVFDSESGKIHLLHIAGSSKKEYKTYSMVSNNGGITWSEPVLVFEGIVGPGHGIEIQNGNYRGRLVVPAYKNGGSLCLYSDDNGDTWHKSNKLPDGNEAEIAEINSGKLLMIVRTNIGVATKHDKLHKIYSVSEDGGASWSGLKTFTDLKEPICMSSIVNTGDALYYSHPDDYYCRGQMTIAVSTDDGTTFDNRKIIYQGASGYSDLGGSYDGDLFLVFENGAVEYDERITFVRVKAFESK